MKFKKLSEGAAKYARSQGIEVFSLGTKQKRWIKALRSGDYTKAVGYLCSLNKKGREYHCCLGVACEVSGLCKTDVESHGRDIGLPKINNAGTITANSMKTFNEEESTLPRDVLDEFEFRENAGEIYNYWKQDVVVRDLSSKKSKYIKEIALYINKFNEHFPGFDSLADMNDGHGKRTFTHKKIAEFVEAYPQAVFNEAV